jgi:hypothetical protein
MNNEEIRPKNIPYVIWPDRDYLCNNIDNLIDRNIESIMILLELLKMASENNPSLVIDTILKTKNKLNIAQKTIDSCCCG